MKTVLSKVLLGFAILMLVAAIYMGVYNFQYISQTAAQYGMPVSSFKKEVIQAVLQGALPYLGQALVIFAAAVVVDRLPAKAKKDEATCCCEAEAVEEAVEDATEEVPVIEEILEAEEAPETAAAAEEADSEETEIKPEA